MALSEIAEEYMTTSPAMLREYSTLSAHMGEKPEINFRNTETDWAERPSAMNVGEFPRWVDTSWAGPADEESTRHREAAAVMDGLARGLLWKISDCTFIPGPDAVELVDDYDDLRAVLRVLRAGWATAAPDGLLVTDRGRDVARQLFVDR